MKQLGISVPILLFFGIWITGGLCAASELTADQQVQPSTAAVGETAMVTLMLSYSGNNGTQVTVTPGFTPGVLADSGPQTDLLSPGSQQMISYPIRAERSGSYWITSLISYTDDGALRQLSKESPFTATGGPIQPEQQPGSAPIPSQPAPDCLRLYTLTRPLLTVVLMTTALSTTDRCLQNTSCTTEPPVPSEQSPVSPGPAEPPADKPAPSGNASV